MGVAHRHFERLIAEQLGDRAQRGTAHHQSRRECVPQLPISDDNRGGQNLWRVTLRRTSRNYFDARPVTWRLSERPIARDNRCVKRLGQSDVHGIVCRDVLAQCPRPSQEIEMSVTVKIEVGEISDRVDGSAR
jgi:hypothetical protein